MDDFLTKKKESAPILDFSKTVATSKEEFKKLFEKVPDFKIKGEKVAVENIKIRDKNFKFKSGKKDLKAMREPYLFLDPLPSEMRSLKISELASVQIDWKMLTTLRPKNKLEEVYFSRLVELGKLQNKSRTHEKRQFQLDPQIRRIKNKSGIIEMRVTSCTECGEDFCDGKACIKFNYDSFARTPEVAKVSQKVISAETKNTANKKKIKRKTRSKSKSKRKSGHKSKSPKRNAKKIRNTLSRIFR